MTVATRHRYPAVHYCYGQTWRIRTEHRCKTDEEHHRSGGGPPSHVQPEELDQRHEMLVVRHVRVVAVLAFDRVGHAFRRFVRERTVVVMVVEVLLRVVQVFRPVAVVEQPKALRTPGRVYAPDGVRRAAAARVVILLFICRRKASALSYGPNGLPIDC